MAFMSNPAVDPAFEDSIFAAEVTDVKRWWAEPRWHHVRRPYSAEQIVAMRGRMMIEYPSDQQASKLWAILDRRFNVGCVVL